jgi:hypothetical protein
VVERIPAEFGEQDKVLCFLCVSLPLSLPLSLSVCVLAMLAVAVVPATRDWEEQYAHAVHIEQEGDLIASFSGCVFILGAPQCHELFHAYADFSETVNGPLARAVAAKAESLSTVQPVQLERNASAV